jgi:hypothetical protein
VKLTALAYYTPASPDCPCIRLPGYPEFAGFPVRPTPDIHFCHFVQMIGKLIRGVKAKTGKKRRAGKKRRILLYSKIPQTGRLDLNKRKMG